MAITTKEEGVWSIDQVYNKQMQGSIWDYDGLNELYSWGRNSGGQLGLNEQHPAGTDSRSSPTQVPGTWTGHFSTGSSGSNAVLYIGKETAGTLWGWGAQPWGLLGQNKAGPSAEAYSSPVQIGGDSNWAQACSATSAFGVKTDGTLWGWGFSDNGSTGSSRTGRSSPTQIPGTDYRTTDYSLCAGDQNGWAIRTNGTLWSWGRNDNGSLGHNNNTSSNYPLQVPGTTWDKLADGASKSMAAIKTNGTLWTWGYGIAGQLGLNEQTSYSSPKQVGSDTTWRSIRMSDSAAWATKTDGTLWAWGRNLEGQLGLGNPTPTYRSSPVQVGSATTWDEKIVQSFPSSIMMKKTDGTLWTWGYNGYGQLGQNSRSNQPTPQQIPGTLWNSIGGSFSAFYGSQLA